MSRSRNGRGNGDKENGFDGGYMAAKKTKLEQQFEADVLSSEASGGTGIFKGISVFVNGYTDPPAEELKRIMMTHGGTFHHYHRPGVTNYVVASNLPDVKIKQLKSSEIYVKPEWITDSVTAGRMLPYKNYLLVTPVSRGQIKLSFKTMTKSIESLKGLPCDAPSRVAVSGTAPVNKVRELEELSSEPAQVMDMCDSDSIVDLREQIFESHEEGEEIGRTPSPEYCTSPSLNGNIGFEFPGPDVPADGELQRHLRAGEKNFLSEFYNRSRLHHISTMGSMFKKYVSDLREKSSGEFPGFKELEHWKITTLRNTSCTSGLSIDKRSGLSNEKVIMHIDMDCFFVSVGLRNHPELIGQPVVVTHARAESKSIKRGDQNRELEFEFYRKKTVERMRDGSGVRPEFSGEESDKLFARITDLDETSSMSEIASCSYEARAKGIKNGMFLGQAIKLCPELKTITYDFEGYQEVALCLYDTIAKYTLEIEAVSCDEMYVDITDVLKKSGCQPLEFTSHIREVIQLKTRCSASTGLGPNLLLARMATKRAKPDGQFHLTSEEAVSYMALQAVESLPGVGRATTYRLQARGVKTCGDLQQMSLAALQKDLGAKTGETLYRHCRGEDSRKLETEHVRKSISVAVNYGIRFVDENEAFKFLQELSEEVAKRMTEAKVSGKKITLQIMSRAKEAPVEAAKFMGHGVCDVYSKSSNLTSATAHASVIEKECVRLLKHLKLPAVDLRGMGIHISRLDVSASKSNTTDKSVLDFFSKRVNSVEPKASSSKTLHSEEPKAQMSEERAEIVNDGISIEVLNALPEDIRREIEEDMKTRQRKLVEPGTTRPPLNPSAIVDLPLSGRKDPTFLSALPLELREEIVKDDKQKTGVASWRVTSFSQIDPSVMMQLPEDLQNEIRNELTAAKPMAPVGPRAGPSKSPRKQSKKKSSPTKKGRKKALVTAGNGNLKQMLQEINKPSTSFAPIPEENNNQATTSLPEKPNLAGAVSLCDVKEFLKEWFESGDDPEIDDVATVTQYFCDLIHHRNLYMLDLLIKYVLRLLKSGKFEKWRECARSIVESVQSVMLVVHKSKLKVESF